MYFTGIKLLDSSHVYMLKLLTCSLSYLLYLLYGFMEHNKISVSITLHEFIYIYIYTHTHTEICSGFKYCSEYVWKIWTTGKLYACTHIAYIRKLSVKTTACIPCTLLTSLYILHITYWSVLVTAKTLRDCSGISLLRTWCHWGAPGSYTLTWKLNIQHYNCVRFQLFTVNKCIKILLNDQLHQS